MNSYVKIVLTAPGAKVPVYAHGGDAGADVYSIASDKDELPQAGTVLYDEKMKSSTSTIGCRLLAPGETAMIDLGIKIQLEPGWEMQVRSRSGMALWGLVVANSPGTIDSNYTGPCMVLLRNTTNEWRVIRPGTRVAQFVLKQAPTAVYHRVESLEETERGDGGFGSSGTR